MKVHYVDHMGSDLSVVNAARVSFGKRSEQLTEKDKGLIRFLARGCTKGDWDKIQDDLMFLSEDHEKDQIEEILNHVKNMPTHWTPFGHTAITLHIKAPIFVARQLGKHQVGMVWNEVSRRYVTDEPEFYTPDAWRKAADNVKQGSGEDLQRNETVMASIYWQDVMEESERAYSCLLNLGVCPEQARMVLPQSMYTEWYWTGNLYSFANVFIQRSDSHAQKEVQQIAEQIDYLLMSLFPVSWPALTRGA